MTTSVPLGAGAASPSHAAARLAEVRERIAVAARQAGRDPAAVELVAVSKTFDAPAILPLVEAGQRSFGENRVQEAEEKWGGGPLSAAAIRGRRLHLVGQLQSNKAATAVRLFDALHSIDRPGLIEAVARAATATLRMPDCFLQVNIGGEPQKGGCAIADLPVLVRRARDAGLRLIGLMCVPPAEREPAPYFALLAKLAAEQGLAGLSMGMSADYQTAVMLGATHVRVGTALFGER